MERKGKRFQTGREIMERFIPDYPPRKTGLRTPDHNAARAGTELAESLIGDFKQRLQGKRLHRPRKSGRA